MKIEMYSDYACPFCYIGKRQLEQALAQFEHADDVEIVHKAFELYPHAGDSVSNTTQGRIERKYGKSPTGAMQMIRGIEAMAAKAGLAMNYENVQNTNTFNAHRLTKLAHSLGKGDAMNERLFQAYFIENLPLANRDNLIRLAEAVGIAREQVENMLDSDAFAAETRADLAQAQQVGVQAVPFFVVDGQVSLAGSQPAAHFLSVLNQVWADSAQPLLQEGAACGVDGCR
ncbi:DsbA family oxidoreductase [Uruburuella testudinis]|uniref:DsbA family oxidoreductase n=1 Tax=Uruburuella testudinis TaxID=1282863 RepID=A0ABY4DR28_9NEIS|nr:DsbA family oxidoreductase [Uruburuella testudinis]UOO81341.1 DsbA family oxidoreductase [Uruburuella testudinis]